MRERAQHDAIDPALEIVRDVAQTLPGIDARSRLINEECVSAEARDSSFKRKTSAQGRLLEEHHNLLARQRSAEVLRTRFDQRGEIEDSGNAGRAEIVD